MVEMPVRFVGDQFCTVENWLYPNNQIESIRCHFSQAETIQAVGRGRWFNNTPKDIWLFSHESLGLNVEIDGWFRYEHWFESSEKLSGVPNHTLRLRAHQQRVELLGSLNLARIHNSRKAFLAIGLSKQFVDYNRTGVFELLGVCGYVLDANGAWWNKSMEEPNDSLPMTAAVSVV